MTGFAKPKLHKPTLEYVANYIEQYVEELRATGITGTEFLGVVKNHLDALLSQEAIPEDYFGSEQEAKDRQFNEELIVARKSTTEALPMRQRQDCALFRCLRCFQHVFPDDDVEEYGDGYIHKVCAPIPEGSDLIEVEFPFGQAKFDDLIFRMKDGVVDQYYALITEVRDAIKDKLGLNQRQLIYVLSHSDNDIAVEQQIFNKLTFMMRTGRVYNKLFFRFKVSREGLMNLGGAEQ